MSVQSVQAPSTPAPYPNCKRTSVSTALPVESPAAKRGNSRIYVDAQLVRRTIPCAVVGCTEVYESTVGNASASTKFICRHHPHTVQLRTAEQNQSQLPPLVREPWSPTYEFADTGKKSYPY